MTYSDDHIALAAEYALGTLSADERALVETMMIVDHGFKEVVEAWDLKFSPLHQMVAAVEPPAHVWDFIKLAAGLTGGRASAADDPAAGDPAADDESPVQQEAGAQQEAAAQDEPAEHPDPSVSQPPDEAADVGAAHPVLAAPDGGVAPEESVADVAAITAAAEQAWAAAQNQSRTDDAAGAPSGEQALPQSANPAEPGGTTASDAAGSQPRGRGGLVYGIAMTGVAAALAAVIALQAQRPDLLPEPLRVKPVVRTVEVAAPAPAPGAQWVAMLQGIAGTPAFILTVDTATWTFTARKVAAPSQPGKSYELWLVSDKLGSPRSLGVIGNSDFTIRPSLAAYDADTIARARFIVTIEPQGGSRTGVMTGPTAYIGRLIESVPAVAATGPAPR
jgi:anti-sigma-K factor RskA